MTLSRPERRRSPLQGEERYRVVGNDPGEGPNWLIYDFKVGREVGHCAVQRDADRIAAALNAQPLDADLLVAAKEVVATASAERTRGAFATLWRIDESVRRLDAALRERKAKA